MSADEISIQASLKDNGALKGLEQLAETMKQLIKIAKQQVDLQINTNQILKTNESINETRNAFKNLSSASSIVDKSIDGIIDTFKNFDGTLNGFIKTLGTMALQILALPFKLVIPLGAEFMNVITSIGKSVIELIGGLGGFVKGMVSFGASLLSIPGTIASNVIGGLSNLVTSFFSTGSSIGTSLVSGIMTPFINLGSSITSTIGSAFSGLANLIMSPFSAIGNIVSSIGSMVTTLLINPFSSFFSIIQNGLSFAIGGFDTFLNILGNIGNILDIYSGAKEILVDVFTGAANAVGFFTDKIGASITAAADFEKQISNVASVTRASSNDMNLLRQAALQVGADTSLSASQAAEALYALGSAGLSAEDSAKALMGTAKLAEATQSNLAQATETVVSSIAQFKLQASDATDIANVFTAGINVSQLTMERLAYSLKYVGPVAGALGVSLQEVTGVLGALSNAGIYGETAGTALRSMMTDLITPTDKLVTSMANLKLITADGIDEKGQMTYSAEAVKKGMDQINPSIVGLSGALEALRSKNITAAQTMQLFGDAAGPAMITLLSMTKEEIDKVTAGVTGTNAAFEAAEIQLDNMKGSMEQLSGSVETLQIMFGTVFQKAGKVFYNVLTESVNAISNFLTKSKLLEAAEAIITGAFYGTYKAVSLLSPILKSVSDAFAALFAKISNGVMAFVDFSSKSELVKNGFAEIKASIQETTKAFNDYLSNSLGIGKITQNFSNGTSSNIARLDDYVASTTIAVDTTKKFFGTLSAIPTIKMPTIGNTSPVKTSSTSPTTPTVDTASIDALASPDRIAAIELLKTEIASLKTIITTLSTSFIDITKSAIEFANKFTQLGGITKNTSSFIEYLTQTIKSMTPAIVSNINSFSSMVVKWFQSQEAIDAVQSGITSFFNALKSLGNFMLSLPDIFSKLYTILFSLCALFTTIAPPIFNLVSILAQFVLKILGINNSLPTMGQALQTTSDYALAFIAMLQQTIIVIVEYITQILETSGILQLLETYIQKIIAKYQEWSAVMQNSDFINGVVSVITALCNKFTELQNMISPLMPTWSELGSAIASLINNFNPLYLAIIPGAIAVLGLLATATVSAGSPINGFTLLLAAAAAGIFIFRDSIASGLQPAMQQIQQAFTNFTSGNFEAGFQNLLNIPKIYFPQLFSFIQSQGTIFQSTYASVMSGATASGNMALQTGLTSANVIAQTETTKMPSFFQTMGTQIAAVIIASGQVIMNGLVSMLQFISNTAIPQITSFITGLRTGFTAGFSLLPEPIKQGMTNIWEAMKTAINVGIQIIVNDIPNLMIAIKDAFVNWWANLKIDGSVQSWVNGLYQLFCSVWNSFVTNISTVILALLPVIGAVFAQIGFGLGQIAMPLLMAAFTAISAGIIGFIGGLASSLGPSVNNLFTSITGYFKLGTGSFLEFIMTALTGLGTAIAGIIGKLFSAATLQVIVQKYWTDFGTYISDGVKKMLEKLVNAFATSKNTVIQAIDGFFAMCGIDVTKGITSIAAKVTTSSIKILAAIISFGEIIYDAFKGVFDKLLTGDLVGALNQFLSNITRMFSIDLGKTLTSAIQGVLLLIGGWKTLFLSVLEPIAAAILKWAKDSFGTFGQTIMIGLTLAGAAWAGFFAGGPVGMVIAFCSAVGVALKAFGVNWDVIWKAITSILAKAWDGIVSVFAAAVASIPSIIGSLTSAFGSAITSLGNVLNVDMLKTFGSWVSGVGEWFKGIGTWIYDMFKTYISTPIYNFLIGHSLIDDMPKWFDSCFEALIAFFGNAYEKMAKAWEVLWGFVMGIKDKIINRALEIPMGIIDNIITTFTETGQKIADTFNGMWSFMTETVTTVIEYATQIGDGIITTLTDIITAGKETIMGIFNAIWEFLSSTIDTVIEIGDNIGSGFMDAITGAIDAGKAVIESVVNGIVSIAQGAYDRVMSIVNAAKKIASAPIDAVVSVAQSAGDFVGSMGYATGGIVKATPGGIPATVGEGQYNEAIVPLPDGRSIPVSFANMPDFSNLAFAANGGGGSVNINFGDVVLNNEQDERAFFNKIDRVVSDALRRNRGR